MKSSVLATLAYADIFDYPLTLDEIWTWVICEDGRHLPAGKAERTEDREKFAHSLQFALNSRLICMTQGFYYLKGREKIVVIRKERGKYSQEKLKIAEKVAGILRFIPWIKLIGITGALARNNADRNDDIDLFFITSQNRLWLTRGTIVLILSLLRLYRRPNKIANMICPNMLVAENALKMTPEDLFTAHEVCLMKPIFERGDTYQKFIRANLWVKRFLPNKLKVIKQFSNLVIESKRKENLLNYSESLARRLQFWYMRKRRTTETVSDNLIKFHPQDIRASVLKEFRKRLKIYCLDKIC